MARRTAQKSKKLEKTRKNSGSWKKTSGKSRKSKQAKGVMFRYMGIFALFSVSFVFLFSVVAFKKLTQPFVSAFSTSSYDLRTEEFYTVVLYSVEDLNSDIIELNQVTVMFFDTTSKRIVSYDVPIDMELDVPGKYAVEPLSRVLALGMTVNNGDFSKAIAVSDQTLANLFAFPIDRYIVVDKNLHDDFQEIFINGNPSIVLDTGFLNSLKASMKTNLSLQEIYFSYSFANSLPQDRFIKRNIDRNLVEHTDILDEEIVNLTFDSKLALEKKSIAVMNGTKEEGIATFGSRVVNNLGGRVISVNNTTQIQEKSVLIVDDKTSETTKSIMRFFNIDDVIYREDVKDIYVSEMDRADVVIILGLDIVDLL